MSSLLPKKLNPAGKLIGNCVYVHKTASEVIDQKILEKAIKRLQLSFPCFNHTIIKHNLTSNSISLIASPDFDTSPEPISGDYIIYHPDHLGGWTSFDIKSKDPFIYHHKWLFVKNDYKGFDISESMLRSLKWLEIPNIDKSRIGRLSYWKQNVIPLLKS